MCRPCGTRFRQASLPGTAVPGFRIPPLRGWGNADRRNIAAGLRPYGSSKTSRPSVSVVTDVLVVFLNRGADYVAALAALLCAEGSLTSQASPKVRKA